MRRPSILVKALIVMSGVFFVFSFSMIQMPEAAFAAFIFFFFLWSVLQSVGRDPNLTDTKSRRYFRFVAFIGLLVILASGYGFVANILNAQYGNAFRSLGPAILILGINWKYRKQWPLWLRK